ncbi:ABC transporter permease subunit [Neobacillus niacini]|uniref:ABC transporter permease subunit n=1 Tax=Neobacillus niacini TaxID=86668 RepID=UPI0028671E73|nr:ABC transporter permease subunit [Neobacillus niacini]MDR7002536.1 ABC-2 type transport system permease protein [Neobacillus niacini]
MNLFLREMKANRKSLIIWCFGILFMVVAGMGKYEGYSSSSGQSINELMSSMPKSLQAMMGVGELDFSTPIGFYGMLFAYLILMAAFHALMIGANIIAKEERDKTTEFLMAKPISRGRIVTAKLVAAFVNVVIFNLVTLGLSVAMVTKFNKAGDPIDVIYTLMAGMLILQLIFLVLGSAMAAQLKKPKRAASIGTAILLIMYILSIAIDLNKKISGLKYVTPFKYFEAKRVITDGTLDPVFSSISLVAIVGLLVGTYIFYRKRDLNT